MTTWMNIVAVATGGAIGSVARYLVTLAAMSVPGGSSAAGTLIVNILGCAAIGALGEYCLINENLSPRLVLAARVGFLGGLTTFSTFAADSVGLWDLGRFSWAAAYLLGNLVFGILALLVAAGFVRAGMNG